MKYKVGPAGGTHRGECVNRAIDCYNRAYGLHISVRPKRRTSVGKALNGLEAVYGEQGQQMAAEECFQHGMDLYKKSTKQKHVDVTATLINLGIIDCTRQNVRETFHKNIFLFKIFSFNLNKH
jgi:hypothetical protein